MNPIAERQVENAVKALGILANTPIAQRERGKGQETFNLTNIVRSLPMGENEEVLLLAEAQEVILSAITEPDGEETPGAVEKFRKLGYFVTIIERDEIGPISIRIEMPKENWSVQMTC